MRWTRPDLVFLTVITGQGEHSGYGKLTTREEMPKVCDWLQTFKNGMALSNQMARASVSQEQLEIECRQM